MTPHLRRAVSGPVLLTAMMVVATAAAPVLREGWLLTWLLLGLASGYALSGST
jgi:hypothetical protein